MNSQQREEAKRLAARLYQIWIFADETTDGEPGYYARIPELPGCVSDGDTIEEAMQNLESAKVDFIYFLLEDGLPVPEPRLLNTCAVNIRGYIDHDDMTATQPLGARALFPRKLEMSTVFA